MNFSFKTVLPLIITFLVLTIIIFATAFLFNEKSISYMMIMAFNSLFFFISFIVFRMQYQAMYNNNPGVFIRSVMGGMIIKVFACLIAIVAYYFISGPAFNKPAVYAAMVIYIIYLVVEVRVIMKLNKIKNA